MLCWEISVWLGLTYFSCDFADRGIHVWHKSFSILVFNFLTLYKIFVAEYNGVIVISLYSYSMIRSPQLSYHILIVDESKSGCKMHERILSRFNHICTIPPSDLKTEDEILSFLKESLLKAAYAIPFDIIVMGSAPRLIQYTKQLGETLTHLIARWLEIRIKLWNWTGFKGKILVVSSRIDSTEIAMLRDIGADDVVERPQMALIFSGSLGKNTKANMMKMILEPILLLHWFITEQNQHDIPHPQTSLRRLQSMRILVVDDIHSNRAVSVCILSRDGNTVSEVECGYDAVNFLKEVLVAARNDYSLNYDVVVLNYNFAVGGLTGAQTDRKSVV